MADGGLPVSVPEDSGNAGFGGPTPAPAGSTNRGSVTQGNLGSDPEDAQKLIDAVDTLDECVRLYRYARSKNADWHDKITTLIEFAEGKQFATWGDDISHVGSRPKRNIVSAAGRHKGGLVSEPPVHIDAFGEDPDTDSHGADVAKAALEKESDRLNRAESIDEMVDWAWKCGSSFIHQGWDPVAQDVQERVIDPRLVDPDPDQPSEKHWSFIFETARVPLDRIRARFPATGKYVSADSGTDLDTGKQPWTSSNDAANVAARITSSSDNPSSDPVADPQFATVVLMYSQGHWTETEMDDPEAFILLCQECDYEQDDVPRSPDVESEDQRQVGDEVDIPCENCQSSLPLLRIPRKRRNTVPQYERGRRLAVFAPNSNVLLWIGSWTDPQIENWPIKRLIWYRRAGSWRGMSETEWLWHLQLLVNKLLLLFSENATMNATPKIVLPRGLGFEQDPWNNIPSQILIAKRPELIEKMRAFAGPDTPQSLIVLFRIVLEEALSESGFTDVALGQVKAGSEISGEAIKSAQASAEVPVRQHLRRRYRLETQLVRDNLRIIQRRWSENRWVRLVDPWGSSSVESVRGDDLLKYDVIVTSEPDEKIDRASTVQAVMQLAPPGLPVGPLQKALLIWLGVPQRLINSAMAAQPPQVPQAPGEAIPPPQGGNQLPAGLMDSLVGNNGVAGGISPQPVMQ